MELGAGLVRVFRKGSLSVPGHVNTNFWEFCGEFDVWIYGVEVMLKFVDTILPGGTVDIINIPEPAFD